MSDVATHPAASHSEPGARAALGVAAICTSFAGLQIALAPGAPLGEHVWGGSQPRVLPGGMRIDDARGFCVDFFGQLAREERR